MRHLVIVVARSLLMIMRAMIGIGRLTILQRLHALLQNCQDSLQVAAVGPGSTYDDAGRAHGAVVASHRLLTIRRSEKRKSTFGTGR